MSVGGPRALSVRRCDDVLVLGPWLAGVTSVAAALRAALPAQTFVEADDLPAGTAPRAVVFVLSAAAPLTDSDAALLDSVAGCTDALIGVLAKTDLYPQWPQLARTARTALAARDLRYADMPWLGVAAAPAAGEPSIDDLVTTLAARLADPDLDRRNRLRCWQSELLGDVARLEDAVADPDRRARLAQLKEQRAEALRTQRLARAERAAALRTRINQARVQLGHFAGKRCTSVRAELAEDAAAAGRRDLPRLQDYLAERTADVVAEVEQGCVEQFADIAAELDLDPPPPAGAPPAVPVGRPAAGTRRVETQLTLLLGVGLGLGVALTASRLFDRLTPGLTVAGAIGGAVLGLLIGGQTVRIRSVLRERAVLERWIGEVIAALRGALDEQVALRVLDAEAAFTAQLTRRDEAEAAQVTHLVVRLDREQRELSEAVAHAAAVRERELPGLRWALAAVRDELAAPATADDG